MPTIEQDLRDGLHRSAVTPGIDVLAVLSSGRRSLVRRRLRRGSSLLVLPFVLAAGVVVTTNRPPTELVGSGLTLATGYDGPVQVSDDRVDLGDGIQAWRKGNDLYIGYPDGPHGWLDTGSINSRWGDLGYDTIVFDDAGETDGSTIVVGSVRGNPRAMRVTIDGVTEDAIVACFDQAPGWCSYKATVPTSIRTYDVPPIVEVRRP